MAFKTKRDLLAWLGQGDGCGELIGSDWLIWVNAGGNIVAQHPTCPDLGVSFCPIADDEESHDNLIDAADAAIAKEEGRSK